MRLLFLLLVLVNAAFYAYTIATRQQGGGERIALLQINPEKIRVVKVTGGPASDKPRPAAPAPPPNSAAVSSPPVPAACLEWGLLAGPDVARADAAIAKLELPQVLVQRVVADAGGFWVYIPPLKGKADVDKKIRELNKLGVTDLFAVQDQTQWRNAISLGIFKTEDSARNFLARLRGKGVRSAVVGRRENFLKQIVYFVREPDKTTVTKLAELQHEFPGTEIKAVTCPPPNSTKGADSSPAS